MITSNTNGSERRKPDSVNVRILRQDGPGQTTYWERHRVPYENDMNVISVLQRIAAQATTVEGKKVAPVAWDCNCLEEICGACTMNINRRVRQACSALVDNLLVENSDEIELRPMTKFPVVRDLVVDRSRIFATLKKVKAWIPVDGSYDVGPGPKQAPEVREEVYPLSKCMSCGCCLEACPQFTKIEPQRKAGETEEQFVARRQKAFEHGFIGAHAISQVVLFNAHPTGKMNANERLNALTAPGGIQVCGNAQNCVAVCPKEIPLTTSIAVAGRAATGFLLRSWFDR